MTNGSHIDYHCGKYPVKMNLQKSYQILDKIKLLYKKLETSNYVMNSYYADAYLNKIKDTSDPEVSLLFITPISGYLTSTLSNVLVMCENYHISVRLFFTKILGYVCTMELYFVKVFAESGDHVNKCFKDIHSPKMNDNLKVAYLEIAISLINHSSGMQWLIESGVWRDILMLVNKKRTLYYVLRHVYLFVSKFMWSLNDIGEIDNLNIALDFILAPIEEIGLINQDVLSDEYEAEICNKIEPMCHMLLAIFTEKDRIHTSNQLMNCLLTERFLINKIGICIYKLRSKEIVLMCTKVSFWAMLGNVFQYKPLRPEILYSKEDLQGLFEFYFHTLRQLIQRRNIKLVLEFVTAGNFIWDTVWQKSTPFLKDNNKNLELQSQMMFISLVPLLMWISKDKKYTELMEDEIIVKNVTTIMNNAHVEQTMRAAYGIRSIIFETENGMIETVIHSVKMLNCLRTHLTDEVATLLFRCLFFVLSDYNRQKGSSQESWCSDLENINAISHIMQVVVSLVKRYNITWNETVEVLNLYSVVHGILKKPDLPPKFVVVSLTALSYSVKEFLTPNLSLLLESTPGSAVHEIGSLINHKMDDEEWEVRDSALELLFVCTDLSFIKFPPFQKQIIEEKLIIAAAGLAFHDQESYVQASALRCLGAAARLPCVWDQLMMEYQGVQEQLLSTLRMNPDGIVRKEACSVLCEMYQHAKMSASSKCRLYEHMVSTALSDFHWEVQLSALRFWRIVIQTLLTDQGMLDGTFPPVTFSKQSRKIVTLNATEIQRRLTKVLDELSSIGCLTVLVKLLNEDSELQIMELALNVSLELLEILDNYKLQEYLNLNGDIARVEDLTIQIINDEEAMDILPSTSVTAENVIGGIFKSDDVNLLSNIYQRHLSIDSESQVKPKIRLIQSASPNLFMVFVKSKDFRVILEQKKQWKEGVRSLSELLDNLIGYEFNEEVNSLDCY